MVLGVYRFIAIMLIQLFSVKDGGVLRGLWPATGSPREAKITLNHLELLPGVTQ